MTIKAYSFTADQPTNNRYVGSMFFLFVTMVDYQIKTALSLRRAIKMDTSR